jgi:hypothetical protein
MAEEVARHLNAWWRRPPSMEQAAGGFLEAAEVGAWCGRGWDQAGRNRCRCVYGEAQRVGTARGVAERVDTARGAAGGMGNFGSLSASFHFAQLHTGWNIASSINGSSRAVLAILGLQVFVKVVLYTLNLLPEFYKNLRFIVLIV